MTYEPFDPLDAPDAGKVGGQLTVRNILRSYHSNYDLFAEAVQNAVDAVHARWRDDVAYEPRLLIRIDLVKNSFTVIDNGVGMTPDTCARAFAPNYSLKAALLSGPSRRLRGHKGVGATFLSYGFNLTQMSSKYMGETWSGEIRDARRWADGTPESKAPLVAPYTEQDQFFLSLDRGTLVRVQCD
ncbi:MAG: ATP-binding protein, partial [Dehalococcoidia bacterium]